MLRVVVTKESESKTHALTLSQWRKQSHKKNHMNNRCTSTLNQRNKRYFPVMRASNAFAVRIRLVTVFVADYYSFIYLNSVSTHLSRRQVETMGTSLRKEKKKNLQYLCGVCSMSNRFNLLTCMNEPQIR